MVEICPGVEGSFGHAADNARYISQGFNKQVPALFISGAHRFNFAGTVEGDNCRFLRETADTSQHMLVEHIHLVYQLRIGTKVPNPPTRHCCGLGETVDGNDAVGNLGDGPKADMRTPVERYTLCREAKSAIACASRPS